MQQMVAEFKFAESSLAASVYRIRVATVPVSLHHWLSLIVLFFLADFAFYIASIAVRTASGCCGRRTACITAARGLHRVGLGLPQLQRQYGMARRRSVSDLGGRGGSRPLALADPSWASLASGWGQAA